MNRRTFIQLCGLLGIMPSATPVSGNTRFTGEVLIIGAGAAGMAAGHLLAQQGIDFQILEAASTYGGRMKRDTTFADFPIPLGAEWLHVDEAELAKIVNDDNVRITTKLRAYNPQDQFGYYEGGELSTENLGKFGDKKFVGSSWLDFFEDYVVPGIAARMRFNAEIVAVNYQGGQVTLTDSNGVDYVGDKVIFTAPLKALQDERVEFHPPLPQNRQTAIAKADIWGGLKVFMEFEKRFYPVLLEFPDSETREGQRAYYDAAYGQNTEQNILGLFAVGTQAKPYLAHRGDALRDYILAELDAIFQGIPSATYIRHKVQNWNEEPFIHSAYLADSSPAKIPSTLAKPVAGKLFFAGDAYTREDDWGGVHNATRSARDAVQALLTALQA